MGTPSSIAITGLRTFLGGRLAQRLMAREATAVVGVDIRRPFRMDDRLRWHRLDLTEPTADSMLVAVLDRERVEVLVHAAFRSEPTADVEYDHELETLGTLHVLHACAAAKVKRLVVLSSTMVYGARPDNPNFLSEDHALRGHDDAHGVRNRVEAEALVASFRERHPETEVTVLRPCWILGPTIDDLVARMFGRPVVPTLLGHDPLLQLVHEDDVLRVLETATLERHPGVFNVVGRGVLPLSTLLALAGKRGVPIPVKLWYSLLGALSQGRSGDAPAGFYDYLRFLFVADGSRGWQEFGEPVFSTRETWSSFVAARRLRAAARRG
jgi:UDP-glucose 4-epimerase